MIEATQRQLEVLEFIIAYSRRHQCSPCIRDIAQHFHISPKGAHDHVLALAKKELISHQRNRSRSIRVLNSPAMGDYFDQVEVPLLGHVAAGKPIMSESHLDDMLYLPKALVGKGNFFAVKVEGDSMIDAAITDGDIAIVRQQTTAENGQIVVVMIEDGYVTLKRYYKEANRIRLQAENQNYGPIYTSDIKILGLLVTIIRHY